MKNLLSLFLGALFGTLIFLTAVTYLSGTPFQDWFSSAHAIAVIPKKMDLSEQEKTLLWRMLNNGSLITPDSIISNITSLYGNLIQVLVGVLAVSGVLSFFAIRWQSEMKTEEFISEKMEKYFSSSEFISAMYPRLSDIVDQRIDDTDTNISHELLGRLEYVEAMLSRIQPEDEPSQDGESNEAS